MPEHLHHLQPTESNDRRSEVSSTLTQHSEYQRALDQVGVDTRADVADDGRIDLNIRQTSHRLAALLSKALHRSASGQKSLDRSRPKPVSVPPQPRSHVDQGPPPRLNLVLQVVGSRGDVQPFVALGRELKNKYNHRVRLATHSSFKDFVTDNGLEFFNIGGDPAELMSYMVKNPGMIPEFQTLRSGDVGNRRRDMFDIITGCWRSCIEPGNGMGSVKDTTFDSVTQNSPGADADVDADTNQPFVADVIIANPPSFAHIHCAERLGCPLHIMFTMPYSPTTAFPHPLANIHSTNADDSVTNFLSYMLVDTLTCQGLGDVINRFRTQLGLEPQPLMWAPGTLARLRVPHTYCWSPALIPKPADWGDHISVAGFYFLDSHTAYSPDANLKAFLDAGEPPLYIGFGSIVVDDPTALTKMIFDAVVKSGKRALISKGWGGLGTDQLDLPESVFMIDNVPHEWLFQRVSAVVHHGGAGTCSAGIKAGRPTVIVPFFGDQQFWGQMISRAKAGPDPIAYKDLDAGKLADQITFALKSETLEAAGKLSKAISQENGVVTGAKCLHDQLDLAKLKCTLLPDRAAVWRLRRTNLLLSALAATVLINEGLLSFHDLKLNRATVYETETGPYDPITGGTGALLSTITTILSGIVDMPVDTLKAMRIHPGTPGDRNNASTPDHSNEVGNSSAADDVVSSSVPEDQETKAASALADGHSASTPRRSLTTALHSHGRDRSDSTPQSPRLRAVDTVLGTTKNVGRIVEAGIKSPMDFTYSLAKGFHNAPKLYGDETVRNFGPITDIKSGLVAAGKEFGFGFYDGITGLLTQPFQGARKEGAAGLLKGIGKGIGGVVLKPGAAIFALPGYTMKGMYKEILAALDYSPLSQILAARTVQGYAEFRTSTAQQRKDVIRLWKIQEPRIIKKRNRDEIVIEWHKTQKQKIRDLVQQRLRNRSRTATSSTDGALSGTSTPTRPSSGDINFDDQELRNAIKQSVESDGTADDTNPLDLERAMRATVLALERRPKFTTGASLDEQDMEIRKALFSGMAHAHLFPVEDEGEDLELVRAVTASLAELDHSERRGRSTEGA